MNSIEELLHIYIYGILEYLIISVTFYLICYILYKKALNEAKIQKREVKNKEIKREVLNSLLSTFVMSALIFIIINTELVHYTKWYVDINQYSLWWLPVGFLLGVLLHDTYFYWLHRLLHIKSIFKYAHAVHHRSTNPTPFTSYSFHFLEALGEGLIIPILLLLIPFHPGSLFFFIVLSLTINVYGHLGYEIAPRWFRNTPLFQIVASSTYHNLHHSKFKGNYGLYFRFWDKISGTENSNYERIYDEIQKRRFSKNEEKHNNKIP